MDKFANGAVWLVSKNISCNKCGFVTENNEHLPDECPQCGRAMISASYDTSLFDYFHAWPFA